jgi:DNA-binding LacI/PurR family transcriptional regulator
MSTEHSLRASDDDRDRLVEQLQRHAADGRLSLDEYAERVDRVLLARTHGELVAIVQDLPAESTVDVGLNHREGARQLIVALLVALLVLAVLGAAVAAFR